MIVVQGATRYVINWTGGVYGDAVVAGTSDNIAAFNSYEKHAVFGVQYLIENMGLGSKGAALFFEAIKENPESSPLTTVVAEDIA